MIDPNHIKMFAERLDDLQEDFGLWLVHGYEERSLLIDHNSNIVGYIGMDGSVAALDKDEFEEINRRIVVTGYIEV